MSKVMEQCTKSLNSKPQTELLCSISTNHPFHFQRHNLFNFSSISIIFCTIGCVEKITTKFVSMLEAMEQHTKSLNSKTQTKLLCSVFANQPSL